MILPTFLIAGAGKSGTTALWATLSKHPEICMASIKEPMFFTRIAGRFEGGNSKNPSSSGNFDLGFQWYDSLFRGCEGKRAIGEASGAYLSVDDAAGLIAQYIPDVKLIFMLREPSARTYSHYWQEIRNGRALPPFEDMVHQKHPSFVRYCHGSRYSKHLSRFYSYFPEEQIKLIIFEEYQESPYAHLKEICEFIGVDSSICASLPNLQVNRSGVPIYRSVQDMLWRLPRMRAAKALPQGFRGIGSTVLKRLRAMNTRIMPYPELPDKVRPDLEALFVGDRAYVAQCLGRMPETWKRG